MFYDWIFFRFGQMLFNFARMFSDHLPVFSIHSNNDSSNSHAHDPVVIRDNNKENLASFLETLKEITWSSLDGYHDPKNAYNSFIKKYSKSYNVCFPVKN